MLRTLTLSEIAKATGGNLVEGPHNEAGTSGAVTISAVSTDTRTIAPGSLFVAIKGENHDGHAYLKEAYDKGAEAFLVSRKLTGVEAVQPYIEVPDTVVALGKVARLVRDAFTGPVVAVTGSVGKTTVKEMLVTVLEAAFAVHRSEANFNNEIGVPQTLFGLTEQHTAAVLEMGMRGAGQIKELCDIAAPTIGVITGIGLSHIELLGSRDNIASAKGELFSSLPEDGLAVFPATDDFAEKLRGLAKCKVLTVAIEAAADIQATDITKHENGWRFTVQSPWGIQKMFIPSPGRFNVQNALLAVAVGGHLGIPLTSIARALLRWTPPKMRLEVLQTAKDVTVLSDAYNAAPDSTIGALEALREFTPGPGGKRIAVLGDMKELGTWSPEAHSMIGRAAAKVRPDMLILVGEAVAKSAAAALGAGYPRESLHHLDTVGQAISLVPLILQPGDVVLIKASRSMGLDKVVEALGVAVPVVSSVPEEVEEPAPTPAEPTPPIAETTFAEPAQPEPPVAEALPAPPVPTVPAVAVSEGAPEATASMPTNIVPPPLPSEPSTSVPPPLPSEEVTEETETGALSHDAANELDMIAPPTDGSGATSPSPPATRDGNAT